MKAQGRSSWPAQPRSVSALGHWGLATLETVKRRLQLLRHRCGELSVLIWPRRGLARKLAVGLAWVAGEVVRPERGGQQQP